MKNEMAQDLNELQRLEFKEAFEEFDKVCNVYNFHIDVCLYITQ